MVDRTKGGDFTGFVGIKRLMKINALGQLGAGVYLSDNETRNYFYTMEKKFHKQCNFACLVLCRDLRMKTRSSS